MTRGWGRFCHRRERREKEWWPTTAVPCIVLLAVVTALHHFRPYLYFLLRTDHASLTWLLTFREPEGQLARWIEALQSYDFEVQHQAGIN